VGYVDPDVPRRPRTRLGRFARAVHHWIVDESRDGRAAEIVAWSNAATALALAAAVAFAAWSRWPGQAPWMGLAAFAGSFVLLRIALVHRVTVWIAALLGTLTVGAVAGGLAWFFAHVIEDSPSAPILAAAVASLLAAAPAASAYAKLAKRRSSDVPDSLLEPVSVPHSR